MTVYELCGVVRDFRTHAGDVRAVDSVDLRIESGEMVAIKGPSGSGKSSLLQLLGALDRPTGGRLAYLGRDLGRLSEGQATRLRRSDFGFVFQQFHLIPTLTAEQQLEAALVVGPLRGSERRQRRKELLDRVGLSSRRDHLPGRLSGGEQQRIAIARALANEPRVVLADEPTGNLDSRTGDEILDLLAGAMPADGVLVVVTHNERVAGRANRVIELEDGRVVSDSREVAQ